MKKIIFMVFIICLYSVSVHGNSGELEKINRKIEEKLGSLFKKNDLWITDYAVLKSNEYGKIRGDERKIRELKKIYNDLNDLERVKSNYLEELTDFSGFNPVLPENKDEYENAVKIILKRIRNKKKRFQSGKFFFSYKDLRKSLKHFLGIMRNSNDDMQFRTQIIKDFHIFVSRGSFGNKEILFTGYAVPVFQGSLKETEKYKYPLYKNPGKFRRKYTRKEIYEGKLKNKKLEIVFLDDPFKALLIEIEGDGIIKLNDESYMHLTYSSSNGKKYRSIGKLLVKDDKIKSWNANVDSIHEYFLDNPEDFFKYAEKNESIVFFDYRIEKSINQHKWLFSEISLAADRKYFPVGTLLLMDLTLPDKRKIRKIGISTDSGGAIKGPGHIDIFMGNNKSGWKNAKKMKQNGKLYLLIMK